MRSSISIDVAAPPELIFSLARNVTRWERLLPHYARSRWIGGNEPRVCSFVARRELIPFIGLGLPVAWRARAWSEPEGLRLRFSHLGGATAGMDVTWRIEPAGAGSRVVIEHVFGPRVPGWSVIVDRLFVRPIAGRTLATFAAIAEALAGDAGAESGRPAAANPRS
jgi:hypothetical protein